MHRKFKVLVVKVFREVKKYYGKNLISFVIFGSVARNTFSPCSDIDFLIICENLPDGRSKRIIDFIENVEVKVEDYIKNLRKKNIFTELSPVIKKPDEVKMGSFLFLDMIEDAVILYDRNDFFRNYLSELKRKLKKYGAKKIYKKGGYYWILKDKIDLKEGVEL